MTRRRSAWLVPVAALGLVAASNAVTVQVRPIINEGRVLASFSAPAALTEEAELVIRRGLVVTFTFTCELRQPATFWFDRTLAETSVAASVKLDTLAGVYQVSKLQDGRVLASERKLRDADVRAWMTTFEQVQIAARAPLERNADYYVRVRLRRSPRPSFSIWPWARDDGSGRAVFTFIR